MSGVLSLRFWHTKPTINYLIVLLLFVLSIAGAEPASVPIASPGYDDPDHESSTPVDDCKSKCLIKDEVTALRKLIRALSQNVAGGLILVSPSICKSYNISVDIAYFRCDFCDKFENCYLTEINIGSSQLTGVLDDALCTFKYLRKLDLHSNYLYGAIPRCLGNLQALQKIYLHNNQLTGTIPESLRNLSSLEVLNLRQNNLNGTIPPSLGELSSLVYLYLYGNLFEGEIPSGLGNLKNLRELRLDENLLNGTLNPALGNLSKIEFLSLSGNYFTGPFPPSYKRLTSLTFFSAAGNFMSGPIPEYITQWKQLRHLNIRGNNFELLPMGIFYLSSLQTLSASDLGGSGFKIPPDATLPQLEFLELRNCSIDGEVPPQIINWSKLSYIDLSFNNLTGGIPNSTSMEKMYSLQDLHLEENNLGGPFPHWIYNRFGILSVDLSYNNFTIPESKKYGARSWNDTTISNRNFVQQMSTEFCGRNRHKGSSLFIDCGGDGTKFEGRSYDADNSPSNFFVNKNKNWAYTCSGREYSGIRKGAGVGLYEKARLCTNSLTYYGFCLQKGKYTVRLHFYRTVQEKGKHLKRVFDIYIQGELVRRDFNITKEAESPTEREIEYSTRTTVTTDNLLKIRLYWAGKGSSMYTYDFGPLISGISVIPEFKNKGSAEERSRRLSVILPATTVLVILLAANFLLDNMIHIYKDSKEYAARKLELAGGRYSIKQLVEATENFSRKRMIGKGRFGEVYRAKLSDQDKGQNIEVAVKKVSLGSKKMEELTQDVLAPTNWEHENLLKCLGGGSHKNMHLLIYEYMENGSLKSAFTGFNSNLQLRDWRKRFKICLGIAQGLKHLHERNENIVHRDIKPSSILLDRDFNPKISDFRLAKVYDEDEENPLNFINKLQENALNFIDKLLENPPNFIDKLKLPYVAPEFKRVNNDITTKVDVYSYGVIVLEIISGKEADPPERAENPKIPYLYDKANILKRKGRLAELIDQSLPINAEEKKKAMIILELAMMCVDATPTLRPNMSDVVAVLEGTKTIEQISESTLRVAETIEQISESTLRVTEPIEQISESTLAVTEERVQNILPSFFNISSF